MYTNVFENSFEWKGIKIDSPDFSRDYKLQDDLIITESVKESDSDARNGFKIRSHKTTRAICQDNYLFMIQDLESSHGNNLRVRTLMNEDESLQGVYIIRPKNQVADDALDNDWNINLIDTGLNTMTGGRLKRLKKLISGETFLMTYGDGLSNVNLSKLIRFHK